MKKITNIALSMALALGFGACTEDIDYTPGKPVADDCILASFVTDDGTQTIVSAADEKKVTITVMRENTTNEATVPLKVLPQTADCFEIPSSVTFAAGAATATFDITFDEVEEEEELYTYGVALDESGVDSYSDSYLVSITGYVLPEANWNTSLGQGIYASGNFGETPCEVLKAEGKNWYKLVTPFDNYSIVVKVDEDNSVRMREQPLAWANVGLPDPELVYVSMNTSYNGTYNYYDPASGVIVMAVDYTCSAGSLGTVMDQILIP